MSRVLVDIRSLIAEANLIKLAYSKRIFLLFKMTNTTFNINNLNSAAFQYASSVIGLNFWLNFEGMYFPALSNARFIAAIAAEDNRPSYCLIKTIKIFSFNIKKILNRHLRWSKDVKSNKGFENKLNKFVNICFVSLSFFLYNINSIWGHFIQIHSIHTNAKRKFYY